MKKRIFKNILEEASRIKQLMILLEDDPSSSSELKDLESAASNLGISDKSAVKGVLPNLLTNKNFSVSIQFKYPVTADISGEDIDLIYKGGSIQSDRAVYHSNDNSIRVYYTSSNLKRILGESKLYVSVQFVDSNGGIDDIIKYGIIRDHPYNAIVKVYSELSNKSSASTVTDISTSTGSEHGISTPSSSGTSIHYEPNIISTGENIIMITMLRYGDIEWEKDEKVNSLPIYRITGGLTQVNISPSPPITTTINNIVISDIFNGSNKLTYTDTKELTLSSLSSGPKLTIETDVDIDKLRDGNNYSVTILSNNQIIGHYNLYLTKIMKN